MKGAIPPKPVATAGPSAAVSSAVATVGGTVAGAGHADGNPAMTTWGADKTAGASAQVEMQRSLRRERACSGYQSEMAQGRGDCGNGSRSQSEPFAKGVFRAICPSLGALLSGERQPASVLDLKESRLSTEYTSASS